MLNVLSSLICLADGVGAGCRDCWVIESEQVSQVQFLLLLYYAAFKSGTFRMYPSKTYVALVGYS